MQSDLNIQWAHVSDGTFSNVAAHTQPVSRYTTKCRCSLVIKVNASYVLEFKLSVKTVRICPLNISGRQYANILYKTIMLLFTVFLYCVYNLMQNVTNLYQIKNVQ